MKIVHTSDWHVGRRWKGIQRFDELEAVLDHLAAFIEAQAIDLVLHSGDVFESRNPPAEAEQLVNRFLVRVGRAGAQMVVVAGNHDDQLRLDARSLLTEFVNVQIIGRPRPAARGGTRFLTTRGGERAVVAALPFASPGAWVSALDLASERAERAHPLRADVRARRPRPLRRLPAGRRQPPHDAHPHRGRRRSANRSAASTSARTGPPRRRPCRRPPSYIALGHIHKPQQIDRAGARLLCRVAPPDGLRRGRRGEDLRRRHGGAGKARQPSSTSPTRAGCRWSTCGLRSPSSRRTADRYRTGWLRVTVPLTDKDPDLNRKVRELLPNALVVRAELPAVEAPAGHPAGERRPAGQALRRLSPARARAGGGRAGPRRPSRTLYDQVAG